MVERGHKPHSLKLKQKYGILGISENTGLTVTFDFLTFNLDFSHDSKILK